MVGYIKKSLTWFRLFYNFQERAVVELRYEDKRVYEESKKAGPYIFKVT